MFGQSSSFNYESFFFQFISVGSSNQCEDKSKAAAEPFLWTTSGGSCDWRQHTGSCSGCCDGYRVTGSRTGSGNLGRASSRRSITGGRTNTRLAYNSSGCCIRSTGPSFIGHYFDPVFCCGHPAQERIHGRNDSPACRRPTCDQSTTTSTDAPGASNATATSPTTATKVFIRYSSRCCVIRRPTSVAALRLSPP